MTWTEERISELTRLWETGSSATVIGKSLGVTKNAVIGKAHRMRLRARPSPIRHDQPGSVRRRVPMPVRPAAPRVMAIPLSPSPAPRLVVRRDGKGPHCLWPHGDPREPDFRFCGAPAVEDKPYCPEHCARAYIVKSSADDRAA